MQWRSYFQFLAYANFIQFLAVVLSVRFTTLLCADYCGPENYTMLAIIALLLILELLVNIVVLAIFFWKVPNSILTKVLGWILIVGFAILSYNFRVKDLGLRTKINFIENSGIVTFSSLIFGVLILMVIIFDPIFQKQSIELSKNVRFLMVAIAIFDILFSITYYFSSELLDPVISASPSLSRSFIFVVSSAASYLAPIKLFWGLPSGIVFLAYSKLKDSPNVENPSAS